MITALKDRWASMFCCLFAVLVLAVAPIAHAQEATSSQTAWRLLDYLSVDYAGAVMDGKVISSSEYAEMSEFAGQVHERIASLPATKAQPALVSKAASLQAAIAAKQEPSAVSAQAHALATDLLAAYPTPLAPNRAPDLARGAALYAENCAACHGATGNADGPNAKSLDPSPIAFADVDRARQRSVFGLYQVIQQGLDGTAMASYAQLSSDDRWDLAFYVGRFAFTDAEATAGEKLWNEDATVRTRFPDLETLTQTTPTALAATIGETKARALTAYLRRHPEVVTRIGGGSLDVARQKLAASLTAYEAGDRKAAADLALAAYLDGFEPVEPSLSARDPALMRRIEGAMGDVRGAIGKAAPVSEVRSQIERLDALFASAGRALAPEKASGFSSFAGAFTILLREGLEALLIVVAMIAFLRKAERSDVLPYVHGGWIAALLAGGLTWAAATFFISISGASRELTEGFGSLIAAAVLISVGLWMHGKAQADAWQIYIREKLSHALSKQSAWFLFLLAFIVVYREVFETILFLTALWTQGGAGAVLAGVGSAIVVLAAIAWAMLRFSKRLPIGRFFEYSANLMAILAVVLAGKGVAALQEAGLLDLHPLPLPRVELLGFFPTIEGVVAQAVTVAILVGGFWWSKQGAARTST
ncbi:cytochrome c/FTR1 family iron permease [Phenylobacterium sp. 20VBR1]|uniref:Cytochrome c/FTR1 family iron permease n=1 Tax=Phenylobacterium glaciei TaxID=2803784 RepID=A0A941D1U2_9CAUL|nr:cytochrome c/FTR1 family iron permease [Phenylobacterium glaciei]MBR7618743.1 cytochrome c/FTR1 family iron permease [Phenylobacterium glaciei]